MIKRILYILICIFRCRNCDFWFGIFYRTKRWIDFCFDIIFENPCVSDCRSYFIAADMGDKRNMVIRCCGRNDGGGFLRTLSCAEAEKISVFLKKRCHPSSPFGSLG